MKPAKIQRYAALLRGVNVGGHRKIPMADLARIAAEAGLANPQTLLQSGNVVFEAAPRAPEAAARLSLALERAFGEAIDVTVRDHAALTAVVEADPFPEAATREPNRLLILFAPDPIDTTAIERLSALAANGERVAAAGGEVAIHYGAGVGKSRLEGRRVEKAVGNWVTARNWNTVRKLVEMTAP